MIDILADTGFFRAGTGVPTVNIGTLQPIS